MSAPLPSLARLSLASEAVPTATVPGSAKRDAVARNATGPAATLPYLDDHVWSLIMEAVEMDDPCKEIGRLCVTNWMLADLCADGILYAELSRRMGFYGLLPDWNAVLRHYRDAGTAPPPGGARGYFQWVCAKRKEVQNQFRGVSVENYNDFRRIVNTLVRTENREPYSTYLIGMVLAQNGDALEAVPTNRADYGALARMAVAQNGRLYFVPTDRADYGELAKIAVARNGGALRSVPTDRADFGEIAAIAVAWDGRALEDVPTDRADYGEIAKIAVAQNGRALEWVPKDRPDYSELEAIAARSL